MNRIEFTAFYPQNMGHLMATILIIFIKNTFFN